MSIYEEALKVYQDAETKRKAEQEERARLKALEKQEMLGQFKPKALDILRDVFGSKFVWIVMDIKYGTKKDWWAVLVKSFSEFTDDDNVVYLWVDHDGHIYWAENKGERFRLGAAVYNLEDIGREIFLKEQSGSLV